VNAARVWLNQGTRDSRLPLSDRSCAFGITKI
jgi:hypothetical protein